MSQNPNTQDSDASSMNLLDWVSGRGLVVTPVPTRIAGQPQEDAESPGAQAFNRMSQEQFLTDLEYDMSQLSNDVKEAQREMDASRPSRWTNARLNRDQSPAQPEHSPSDPSCSPRVDSGFATNTIPVECDQVRRLQQSPADPFPDPAVADATSPTEKGVSDDGNGLTGIAAGDGEPPLVDSERAASELQDEEPANTPSIETPGQPVDVEDQRDLESSNHGKEAEPGQVAAGNDNDPNETQTQGTEAASLPRKRGQQKGRRSKERSAKLMRREESRMESTESRNGTTLSFSVLGATSGITCSIHRVTISQPGPVGITVARQELSPLFVRGGSAQTSHGPDEDGTMCLVQVIKDPESLAQKSGLQVGDIFVSIEDLESAEATFERSISMDKIVPRTYDEVVELIRHGSRPVSLWVLREEQHPGLDSSDIVPFCALCNPTAVSRAKMHHAWCPQHPLYSSSGAQEILNRINRGRSLRCRVCMQEYQLGRTLRDATHSRECIRSQTRLLKQSSKQSRPQEKTNSASNLVGKKVTAPLKPRQPPNRRKPSVAAAPERKSDDSSSDEDESFNGDAHVSQSSTRSLKQAVSGVHSALRSTKDLYSNHVRHGESRSVRFEPLSSNMASDCAHGLSHDGEEIIYDDSDEPLDIEWIPCANPWGPSGYVPGDVLLYAPTIGALDHEIHLDSPRYTVDPFESSIRYKTTHRTVDEGFQPLVVRRDPMGQIPWGFVCGRHEFGGACIVQSVDPHSPADSSVSQRQRQQPDPRRNHLQFLFLHSSEEIPHSILIREFWAQGKRHDPLCQWQSGGRND
jgi:hypothetical protein